MVCIRFFGIQIMDILQVKRHDTLQSFSKEMQMPCLIITKNTFTLLLQNMTDITEQIDSHVRIRMSEKTAMDAYRAWVKTLKGKIPEVYKL